MIEPEQLAAFKRSSRRSGLLSAVGFLFVGGAIGYGIWQTMQLNQAIEQKKGELTELQNKVSDSRTEIATLDEQKKLLLTQIKTVEQAVQANEPASHASRIFEQVAQKQPFPIKEKIVPSLTPLFAVVQPRATAQPLDTKNSARQAEFQYSLSVDVPPDRVPEIASVSYEFNHPTFSEKIQTSSDASNGFRIGYRGWGCLSLVVITLNLKDGKKQPVNFDQCAGLQTNI